MAHLVSFLFFAREEKVKILDSLGVKYLSITALICILTYCPARLALATNPQVSGIRVVMDNNYPPHAFLDEQGNTQGILLTSGTIDEFNSPHSLS
jgi:hypothetical protein